MAEEIRVWVQARGTRPLSLDWIDPDTGRRKSKSAETRDPTIAEENRAKHQYELNHGIYSAKSNMPWSKFRETYEEDKLAGDSANSRLKANYVFDSFEEVIGDIKLGKITERTIAKYVTHLRSEGKAPATILGYLAYIKAALRWAQEFNYISKAPKIVMPKVPKGTSRAKIRIASRITQKDFARLLETSPTDGWRLLVSFAWHCGMRRCEAMQVRGEHIDLDTHKIKIPKNKANDEDAVVLIPPEFDASLRQMFPGGIPAGPMVKDVPSDEKTLSNHFRTLVAVPAVVQGNGRGGFCTLHDLRRSYGSRWTLKVPAQVLQKMMRHANIATTMDFYADAEQAAMNAMWGESSATSVSVASNVAVSNSSKKSEPVNLTQPVAN